MLPNAEKLSYLKARTGVGSCFCVPYMRVNVTAVEMKNQTIGQIPGLNFPRVSL